ncbi:MAG: thiamine phosphate synthase [bacterium]|nr:thiamine phosphate synthase [bacterium]
MIPLPPFRLLITPGLSDPSNFSVQKTQILRTVDLAVAAGIEIVQIREKQLPARLLFELARDAAVLTKSSKTKLFINERFDIALAARADGVHLTSTALPVERVRGSVPPDFIIGTSTHSSAEVVAAKDAGADYVMIGPVFATPGKGDPIGLDALQEICESVSPFPVVGVGGIDASNESLVTGAGAAGFAAIRYLNDFVRIGQ